MISVLNQTSSLIAEDALSSTETNLQGSLQELSTGLRINSGADDPAGLSIADGLGANISALNQSTTNASNGVGLLQTADGALSQVATLLNQAVTIATEASNGGLTAAQSTAANTELQSILTNINEIGSTTNFNGTAVFGASDTYAAGAAATGTTLSSSTALQTGEAISITDGTGNTFTYTAAAGSTVGDLVTAINDAASGTTYSGSGTVATTGTIPSTLSASLSSSGKLSISDPANTSLTITDTGGTATTGTLGTATSGGTSGAETLTFGSSVTSSTALETGEAISISGGTSPFSYTAAAGSTVGSLITAINGSGDGLTASISGGKLVIDSGGTTALSGTDTPGTVSTFGAFTQASATNDATIFTSDGTSSGSTLTSAAIGSISSGSLGLGSANLLTTSAAQAALTAITAAINTVSAQEGSIGSSVNQLTADQSVESTEVQNLTNAQNSVQDADVGKTVSNMTEYNVLEQTGMAALSQAQNAEQNVLKLVQNLP